MLIKETGQKIIKSKMSEHPSDIIIARLDYDSFTLNQIMFSSQFFFWYTKGTVKYEDSQFTSFDLVSNLV